MTAACLILDPFPKAGVLDRGLSEDAESIRRMTAEATTPTSSVTLGAVQVRALQNLEQARHAATIENWDGEGSAAADPLSYAYTRLFIGRLRSDLPVPEIYVEPDGEYCVEWDYGHRSIFSVSVARDGTLTYAGLFGTSKAHGMETLLEGIPGPVATGIERVVARADTP